MSSTVLVDTSMRLISALIDDYADWYTQALRHIYYADDAQETAFPDMPKALLTLKDMLGSEPSLRTGEITRVFHAADVLQDMVMRAMTHAGPLRIFTYEQFCEFNQAYDEMLRRLHHIERSQYLSGLGYDPITGLRSGEVWQADLEREMERMARRGRGFALALARLDHVDDLQARHAAGFDQILHHLGSSILYTIRTFDDAYHLPNHEFLLALKHTDLHGAERCAARLKDYVTDAPPRIGPDAIDLSLSFCVAEPIVGQDLGQFVDAMRRDLDMRGNDKASAFVYHEEESALHRYMREQQGDAAG